MKNDANRELGLPERLTITSLGIKTLDMIVAQTRKGVPEQEANQTTRWQAWYEEIPGRQDTVVDAEVFDPAYLLEVSPGDSSYEEGQVAVLLSVRGPAHMVRRARSEVDEAYGDPVAIEATDSLSLTGIWISPSAETTPQL